MREPCPQTNFCSMRNEQRETENQNIVARSEQASAVGGKRPRISALTPPSKPLLTPLSWSGTRTQHSPISTRAFSTHARPGLR